MAPRLTPVGPTQGDSVVVDRSPFWIGSSSSCGLRIYLPGVAERHASISERQDGYYLSPFGPTTAVRLNGHPVTAATKLLDEGVIELGPSARYEFVTGESRVKPVMEEPEPSDEASLAPGRKRAWWQRRRRVRSSRSTTPWGLLIVGAVVLGGLGYLAVTTIRRVRSVAGEADSIPTLSELDQQTFDSLMAEATTRFERAATLLDFGATDEAANQLTEALVLLKSSTIADNAWFIPAINTFNNAAVDLYQFNKRTRVGGMEKVKNSFKDLGGSLGSKLSPQLFALAVDEAQRAFTARFQRTFEITGRDHPEHLSLYGPGSAFDVRTRDLPAEQVQFLIGAFGDRGIRVKDFSVDAILLAQIQAAIKRGVPDRAGTGKHLHIDRFRDRRDKYTVTPR